MKEKWADEKINGLIDHYLNKSKEWLEAQDMDSAYRYLITAIKLRRAL